MKIQIHGAGFHNYGAWLMQDTVMDELTRRFPDADLEFCATPGSHSTYRLHADHRLQIVLPAYRRNLYRRALAAFINRGFPADWRRLWGIVASDEVDALIDVSGYAFGDAWPNTGKYFGLARRFAQLRKRGKPVVMLPQMLGPFKNETVRAATQAMLNQVDHVYARDTDSLAACQEIIRDQGRLSLAPDITIFAEGIAAPQRPPYACIVPNQRMLDKGGDQWRDKYFDLLTHAISQTHEFGLDVVLLSHAPGDGDLDIAKKLLPRVDPTRTEVVSDLSPRTAKGVLAASQYVVGSRFHALVAALSSGVPVIALGWAHKYPRLLADFGIPDHNLDPNEGQEKLTRLIRKCADQGSCHAISEGLRTVKKQMQDANEAMWTDLVERLSSIGARG